MASLTFSADEAPYVALALAQQAQIHSVRAYDYQALGEKREARRHSEHASMFEYLAKKGGVRDLPYTGTGRKPVQTDLFDPTDEE